MKKAGIIGGSGFIGSYNTKKFLSEGYQVRVSTTDLANRSKYAHLFELPNAENLEVMQLDVADEKQLERFLSGCAIVVHGGTPFQLEVADVQKELLDPTIKGTENFLKTVLNTQGIEKVVFIASVGAMNTNFPLLPAGKVAGEVISEADPFYMSEESHPYAQAKFIANKAVVNFVAQHKELPFEIVSVSPTGVMGMALSKREDSTSMGIQYLFKNKIAPNPFIQSFYDNNILWAVVDVADVAEAVFKAATNPGLHGKNYLLSSESYKVSDITLMLNKENPEGEPVVVYSNELAKKELGITFIPAKETLASYQA